TGGLPGSSATGAVEDQDGADHRRLGRRRRRPRRDCRWQEGRAHRRGTWRRRSCDIRGHSSTLTVKGEGPQLGEATTLCALLLAESIERPGGPPPPALRTQNPQPAYT